LLKIYTAELYIKSGLPIVKLFFGHKEITVAKIKAKADKVKEVFNCLFCRSNQIHNKYLKFKTFMIKTIIFYYFKMLKSIVFFKFYKYLLYQYDKISIFQHQFPAHVCRFCF